MRRLRVKYRKVFLEVEAGRWMKWNFWGMNGGRLSSGFMSLKNHSVISYLAKRTENVAFVNDVERNLKGQGE